MESAYFAPIGLNSIQKCIFYTILLYKINFPCYAPASAMKMHQIIKLFSALGLLVATSAFCQTETTSANETATPIRWDQPDVGCVEELFPKLPSDEDCNAKKLSPELVLRCEAKTDVEAETQKAGIQVPFIRWLSLHTFIDRDEKIELIYDSASKYGLPPEYLYGVIDLEGSLADLGIIRDGENYSCGTGSINIGQWCKWMNTLPPEAQTKANWPSGLACDDDTLPAEIVSTIFNHANFSQSASLPEAAHVEMEQQLRPVEANSVSDQFILNDLHTKFFVEAPPSFDAARLKALRSFTNFCGDIHYAIPAIAYSLKDIFDRLVPTQLKNAQVYKNSETFSRSCKYPYSSIYYPLHPGWLLAYAIHNEGEELGAALTHRQFQKKIKQTQNFNVADLRKLFAINATARALAAAPMSNMGHVIRRMMLDQSDPSLPLNSSPVSNSTRVNAFAFWVK
jgi:hypothetical protein